jgi:hypothetical protein
MMLLLSEANLCQKLPSQGVHEIQVQKRRWRVQGIFTIQASRLK